MKSRLPRSPHGKSPPRRASRKTTPAETNTQTAPAQTTSIPKSAPPPTAAQTPLKHRRFGTATRLRCLSKGFLQPHRIDRDPVSSFAQKTSATSRYSHSIVPGGFDVMSYTTRLIPGTSFTMRLEIVLSTSCGRGAQSAVMPSSLVTARIAHVYAYVR